MAKFDRAVSSLGGVEERLRRSLSLVGLIETDFEPSLTPITIADDSTRPGCNVLRNRSFMETVLATINGGGAVGVVCWRTLNPIIIDRVEVNARLNLAVPDATFTNAQCRLSIAPAGTADPFALATNAGFFVENQIGADRPGLLRGIGGVATGTPVAHFTAFRDQNWSMETRIMLPAGGLILIDNTSDATNNQALGVNLYGRLF